MNADFELTPAGLSLHPDTACHISPGELWNTLIRGRGLRIPVKPTSLPAKPSNPLDTCAASLFAPLSAEDYAQALEWATQPEAVRVIHRNMQYLDQRLNDMREHHIERLWGFLRSDGQVSEVRFIAQGRTWRWHHALGLSPVLETGERP